MLNDEFEVVFQDDNFKITKKILCDQNTQKNCTLEAPPNQLPI